MTFVARDLVINWAPVHISRYLYGCEDLHGEINANESKRG